MMNDASFTFAPIDLDSAASLAVKMRADSFAASFGSDERFFEADGKGHERYLVWLRTRMNDMPGSCVHVWRNGRIVGQIELGRYREDPQVGYVYLYYLLPEFRNKGLGADLDRFAAGYLAGHGFPKARLSASPTNRQAMAFYLKHGWIDLGPRKDHPEVHDLEKVFPGAGTLRGDETIGGEDSP